MKLYVLCKIVVTRDYIDKARYKDICYLYSTAAVVMCVCVWTTTMAEPIV